MFLIMRELSHSVYLESDDFSNVELRRSDTIDISKYKNEELRIVNNSGTEIYGELQLSEVDIRIKEQKENGGGDVVVDEILTPIVISSIQTPVRVVGEFEVPELVFPAVQKVSLDGPLEINLPYSTNEAPGIAKIATKDEVIKGENENAFVTPRTLKENDFAINELKYSRDNVLNLNYAEHHPDDSSKSDYVLIVTTSKYNDSVMPVVKLCGAGLGVDYTSPFEIYLSHYFYDFNWLNPTANIISVIEPRAKIYLCEYRGFVAYCLPASYYMRLTVAVIDAKTKKGMMTDGWKFIFQTIEEALNNDRLAEFTVRVNSKLTSVSNHCAPELRFELIDEARKTAYKRVVDPLISESLLFESKLDFEAAKEYKERAEHFRVKIKKDFPWVIE